MHLMVIVHTPPYSTEDLDTAYHLIRAFVKRGNTCTLYLYGDAVIAVNKNTRPSRSDRFIPGMIGDLVKMGVEVMTCGACMQYRGMKREDIVEGVKPAGLATLGEVSAKADRLINFI